MNQFTQLLIRRQREKERYFQNYLIYAQRIKKEAKKLLGETRVFVFGSILKKDEVPQDIDILIISPKLQKPSQKSQVRVKMGKKIGLFSPFELHLITPEEYKNWYQYFLKEKVEI